MRLKVYLKHSIDHMEDHLRDLRAQAPYMSEPQLEQALGRAIADVESARLSLAAVLDLLRGAPAHAHDHVHDHAQGTPRDHVHKHEHGHCHDHPHP